MAFKIFRDPITIKRYRRFREIRRAWFSLWILAVLYILSLAAEVICNDMPLYVRFNGKSYYPVIRFYPEKEFYNNGSDRRTDFKALNRTELFRKNNGNFMLFTPLRFGPDEIIEPDSIHVPDEINVVFSKIPLMGWVNVNRDGAIVRSHLFEPFAGKEEKELPRKNLSAYFSLTPLIEQAMKERFANRPAEAVRDKVKRNDGKLFQCSLSSYSSRSRPPGHVRLSFRKTAANRMEKIKMAFNRALEPVSGGKKLWPMLNDSSRKRILNQVEKRFGGPVDPFIMEVNDHLYRIEIYKNDVRYPYQPTFRHPMGIDSAGRDVLARIFYGLRTSLTFGLLLVTFSMALGIIAGAVQGYYGGGLDITGQRLIEIWSALPFLYIMILMGNIYGRSFGLLLFCYGIFNWIGISCYMRAEFLKLRKQPFVEAARCMGISSWKIIIKHILPNSLVPVITFFPFSRVGAIGSLAALDYLGFGLPPPTPSWGELIQQAQNFRGAWWLIMFPSLSLFTVMLLGIFVGDGVRNAYDPKRYTRLD